jgi:hypothetical protein
MVTLKTVFITFDGILARWFLILAALAVALMILALPPEGFFFSLPFLLLMTALFFGAIGGLFLLAARGLKRDAPWQWIVQVVPLLILACIILLLLLQ